MLYGTICYNQWHNISGLIDYLNGHPFKNNTRFHRAFSTYSYDGVMAPEPEESKVRVLQRFLLAFTIARPATMLALDKAQRYMVGFNIDDEDAITVTGLVSRYLQAARDSARKKNRTRVLTGGVAEPDDNKPKHLVFAVRAQLCALNRALMPQSVDGMKTTRTYTLTTTSTCLSSSTASMPTQGPTGLAASMNQNRTFGGPPGPKIS